MADLAGKVALVTGASGNLGSVVARRLLQAGARVALPDRSPARLERAFSLHLRYLTNGQWPTGWK